jgi:DNA-binding PadR family transcriptional regulator
VSAIRLFILGTLAASGPLHGHQIRHHAQTDRTELWADVQPGSLYGALKRLAGEGLIREVRTEREGNRPERTVYEITTEGRRSLSALHDVAMHEIVSANDPFDLALALSRDLPERNLEGVVADRLAALRAQESSHRHRADRADPYVNEAERMIIQHVIERTLAEIRWHEELLARMPKIIADFTEGIGGVKHPGPSENRLPATDQREDKP